MRKSKLKKINAVILGSGGYTGSELVNILSKHPYVKIQNFGSERVLTGKRKNINDKLSLIDVVFCCLPDGEAQKFAIKNHKKVTIIDLSGDFRLKNPASYLQYYGKNHKASNLLPEATYGLTELCKNEIKKSKLIANPGCYPTSILLAIIPLISGGLINPRNIIIDAKSGFSGAGRKNARRFGKKTFEGFYPYGAISHKHVPEIEQCVQEKTKKKAAITFVPHLIPVERGILSTIYVTLKKGLDAQHVRKKLNEIYRKEKFIRVLKSGVLPSTRNVNNTNVCLIAVLDGKHKGQAIIVSAIDNLVKGASGQAVQNMNLIYGFPEDTALEYRINLS